MTRKRAPRVVYCITTGVNSGRWFGQLLAAEWAIEMHWPEAEVVRYVLAPAGKRKAKRG